MVWQKRKVRRGIRNMFYIDLLAENLEGLGVWVGSFLLIASILILFLKSRDTMFLGFWLLFEGISNILTTVIYKLFRHRFWLYNQAVNVATVLSVIKLLMSLTAIFFLIFYAYARYRSKAFIPVTVLKLVQILISIFVSDLLYSDEFRSLTGYMDIFAQIIVELSLMAAIALITFKVFSKHKEEELFLKKLYRVPLFQLICYCVNIFNWILLRNRSKAADLLLMIVFSFAILFIPPASAIYLLFKAPKKKVYNISVEDPNG